MGKDPEKQKEQKILFEKYARQYEEKNKADMKLSEIVLDKREDKCEEDDFGDF